MAGKVLTYSPKDVKIVLSGYTLTGVLAVNVEWHAPQMSIRRGIRGQHTRVGNLDLSCTVTLDVMQTSVTNEILYEIFRIDRGTGSARLDISISDTSSQAILSSAEAYVSALPAVKYSEGFDARSWNIEVLSVTDGRLTGSIDQTESFFASVPGIDSLKSVLGI